MRKELSGCEFLEKEVQNSLVIGAPTPELRKELQDRFDLYNGAMDGDMRAIVLLSGELGLCSPKEANSFLQEYGHLIDTE